MEVFARSVVDAGLKVHKALGPGLLESAYEHCLAYELHARGLNERRQVALPISYEGTTLDAGYRLDLLVEELIVVEVKSVDALTRLHEAQVLTYLKLSGASPGFPYELQRRTVQERTTQAQALALCSLCPLWLD